MVFACKGGASLQKVLLFFGPGLEDSYQASVLLQFIDYLYSLSVAKGNNERTTSDDTRLTLWTFTSLNSSLPPDPHEFAAGATLI